MILVLIIILLVHRLLPRPTQPPLLPYASDENPASIKKKYYADPILIDHNGHTLLSDVLIVYFQSMTCQSWHVISGEEYDPMTGTYKEKGGGGLFDGIGLRKGVPEPKHKLNNPNKEVVVGYIG